MNKSGDPVATQFAIIAQKPNTLIKASNVAIPSIQKSQVLVKVKAVALNPSDWKLWDVATCTPGAIAGSDFSGTVVWAGESVSEYRVGDCVFGCVFGSNPGRPTNGAFAEYVAADAELCFKMPEAMSFEVAASMGLGLMTVGLMFRSIGLINEQNMNWQPHRNRAVLVYGASTATGTLTITLLKMRGFAPIAICSTKASERVRGLGAVMAFDYHSPSCMEDVRNFTQGRLEFALDCITDPRSTWICYGALGLNGGRYCALESFPQTLLHRRRDVIPEWILGWTIFGEAVDLPGAYRREPQPGDREFAARWATECNDAMSDGKLKSHPLQISKGIFQIVEDIHLLRRGQIVARKLVYTT